jgi:hypothetical protein
MRHLLVVIVSLAACTGPARDPAVQPANPVDNAPAIAPPATAAPAEAKPACLERMKILHSESVLQEQRSKGPAAPDFQTAFAAAKIGPDHLAVEAVESFAVNGAPILWFTPDRRTAVVDERVFGDLATVDPLRFSSGQTGTVGRILVGRDALSGRDVAKFLIRAGIVRVYWHVEADVCLADEKTESGAYSVRVSGEHTYFTNRENRDPFDFELRIAADGAISVSDLPQP